MAHQTLGNGELSDRYKVPLHASSQRGTCVLA